MKDPSLWETVEHNAQGVAVQGGGKNHENSAPGGQCRVQCTRGHTKAVHTRGRAERSAQVARAASCCPKDTENNSHFSHGAKTVYGCMTNYYEVKLVRRNIGNI